MTQLLCILSPYPVPPCIVESARLSPDSEDPNNFVLLTRELRILHDKKILRFYVDGDVVRVTFRKSYTDYMNQSRKIFLHQVVERFPKASIPFLGTCKPARITRE